MHLRAGSVGFAYKEWKGGFYSERCADRAMLTEYAEKLPTVELNNTFYRMPKRSVVAGWRERTRDGFLFSVKATKHVTHVKRLGDVDETLGFMFRSLDELGEKLGAVLFQLPPQLRRDLPLLEAFLARLPETCRPALEFRNASWFRDETYDLLRAHNAALAVNDLGDARRSSPFVSTADWGYVRLLRQEYEPAALEAWTERIASQRWEEAFVFFDSKAWGPRYAERLNELGAESSGPSVAKTTSESGDKPKSESA